MEGKPSRHRCLGIWHAARRSVYLLREDGHFYEARVTYFETLKNLGFTPTRDLASPKDVEEAMDRPVGIHRDQSLFRCHTTASTIDDKFDEENLIPGVTCEACHGPAGQACRRHE